MPANAQIIDRCASYFVLVTHGLHAQFHRQLGDLVTQIGQRVNEFLHLFLDALFFNEVLHQFAKFFQARTIVHQDFAPQQIERLNGIGTFVNHVDARIAHKLFHAPLGNITMAAIDLQAIGSRYPAVIGQKCLGNRGQ